MTIILQSGHSLTDGTHAHILHARNWALPRSTTAFPASAACSPDALMNTLTYEMCKPFEDQKVVSTDFSDGWALTDVTFDAAGQEMTVIATTGQHDFSQPVSGLKSNTDYVHAIKIRLGTLKDIRLRLNDGTTNCTVWFNLETLTVGTELNSTGKIVSLGNNEYLLIQRLTTTDTGAFVEISAGNGAEAPSFLGTGETVTIQEYIRHESIAYITSKGFRSQEADCFCIAAHNIGTGGGEVFFLHDTNEDGSYFEMGSVAPSDDSPIMFIFQPVSSRDWRLRVEGVVDLQIAVWRIGKALKMQRPIYGGHAPLDLGRQTEYRTNRSETGEILGRYRQRSSLATPFQWPYLTADWVRSNWMGLQRASEDDAMFIAWRPDSFGEVGFGEVTASPAAENIGQADLMSASLSFRGYAYD